MQFVTACPDSILGLDVSCGRPGRVATLYVIINQQRAMVIDAGVNASVPRVLSALAAALIEPDKVDWLVLTHVHAGHASGVGSLMCAFPNARLVVHPQGVAYVVEPLRMWQQIENLFGSERALQWYGRPVPVSGDRVLPCQDGLILDLAGRQFVVLETPGYAQHHVSIWDENARVFFCGDVFGLSYRQLDVEGCPFVLPAILPEQFDPVAQHQSIERLLRYQPKAMCLSHCGRVGDVKRLGSDLHRLIDAYMAVARAARGTGVGRHVEIIAGLEQIVQEEAERQGWLIAMDEALQLLESDISFSAQGLGVWLDSGAAESTVEAAMISRAG